MSEDIVKTLERMETMLTTLVERQTLREWYSTDEFARLVGKAEFTTREWCRLGRIHAEKRRSGRGAFPAWVISHQELLRYQREGLLPPEGPFSGRLLPPRLAAGWRNGNAAQESIPAKGALPCRAGAFPPQWPAAYSKTGLTALATVLGYRDRVDQTSLSDAGN